MNYIQYKNNPDLELPEHIKREIESAERRINHIAKHLSNEFNVDIFENTRSRINVIYRKVVAWFMKYYYDYSSMIIATVMNKDHSTIIYYISELNDLYYIKKDRKKKHREYAKKTIAKIINYYDEPMKNVYGIISMCETFLVRLDNLNILNTFIDNEYCPEIYKILHKRHKMPFRLLREGEHKVYVLIKADINEKDVRKAYDDLMKELNTMQSKEYYKGVEFIVMTFPPNNKH